MTDKLSVVIDIAEMAVRIMEAMADQERPHPDAPTSLEHVPPVLRDRSMVAAERALDYIVEQLGGEVIRRNTYLM